MRGLGVFRCLLKPSITETETGNITPNVVTARTEKNTVKKSSIKKRELVKYAEFVSMTKDEYSKLIVKYGEIFTENCIKTLNNYKGSNGKTYENDYLAILNWVIRRVTEESGNSANQRSNFQNRMNAGIYAHCQPVQGSSQKDYDKDFFALLNNNGNSSIAGGNNV